MPFQKGHPFYGDLTKPNYFQKGQPKPKNAYRWPKGHPRFGKGTLGKHLPPAWNKGNHSCLNTGRTHVEKGQHLSANTEFRKGGISYSQGKFGKDSFGWKGGKTPLTTLIRRSEKYKEWRRINFLRDNFICQFCGRRGGYLEAHHYIKTFLEILKDSNIKNMEQAIQSEELWNIDNGITLCKNCHDLTKNGSPEKI